MRLTTNMKLQKLGGVEMRLLFFLEKGKFWEKKQRH